jgi:hypothetical protein
MQQRLGWMSCVAVVSTPVTVPGANALVVEIFLLTVSKIQQGPLTGLEQAAHIVAALVPNPVALTL